MTGTRRYGPTRVAMISMHTSPLDQPGTGDGGGLNVYVVQTARRLAQRGVHVDIFTRRASVDVPDTHALADGVDVHHVSAGPAQPVDKADLPNLLNPFAIALLGHPTAGSHDLVHAQYWLSGWVGRRVAPRWRVPLVATFHTLGILKNSTLAPGDVAEPSLRLLSEHRIATSADRVLALGCQEAAWLHALLGVSGRRISVVPAGVDLDLFRPADPHPSESRPADAPAQLLFVGRLQPLKGPEVAIATLAEVRRRHPNARLTVIGGPSGSDQQATTPADLRRLAINLGVANAVTFLPAQPQVALADLYRSADVVLAPSRSETFGLVALEAQAVGTPVVAAAVGGLNAVVTDGGLRVDGHDPADHARAVSRILEDPSLRRRLVAGGIAAGRAHSWDITVDRLLDAYGAVTSRHRVEGRRVLERAS